MVPEKLWTGSGCQVAKLTGKTRVPGFPMCSLGAIAAQKLFVSMETISARAKRMGWQSQAAP